MFIVALVTGLVLISLPEGPRGPQAEARAISLAANLAAREAISEGRTHTLSVSEDGWEVRQFASGAWQTRAGADWTARPRLFVENVPLELSEQPDPAIVFEPTGGATPFRLELGQGRDAWRVEMDTTGRAEALPAGGRRAR